MPELPEVETTCRAIRPYMLGKPIAALLCRRYDLRWPIPKDMTHNVADSVVKSVQRRSKYILIELSSGTMLVHLGMSGTIRIEKPGAAYRKHDHVVLTFADCALHYHDPRRFGCWLWQPRGTVHKLLQNLGPEPLSAHWTARHMREAARQKNMPVKQWLMDAKNVVGVGNIYASESLFIAGIHPQTPAGQLSWPRCLRLNRAVRCVLQKAIQAGGTTLKDFRQSDGEPGYFAVDLKVYGRQDKTCHRCGSLIKHCAMAGRATYYCDTCQR